MTLADTSLPARMAQLPRDPRGYPIPFVVLRGADGIAHYVINDLDKTHACARHDLCSICGTKLEKARWFIGGVRNAFHRHGAYLDPPVHDECAHYALKVCPFLATPSYKGAHLEAAMKRAKKSGGSQVFVDNTVTAGKPVVFVAVLTARQKTTTRPDGVVYQAVRPYRTVEFWRDGERMPQKEGFAIRNAVLSGEMEPTK